MFRPAKWFVLCIVAGFLSTRAFCAADPATIAKNIDQEVRALAAPSPEARLGAQVRLYDYGPEYFPAIEAASQRKDLAPEQTAKLQEIVEHVRPWIGARNRANRQFEAGQRWHQADCLAAYDAAGKKNPKWDAAARQAITLYFGPKGATSPATRAALESVIQLGCDDPLITYLEARCLELSSKKDPRQKEIGQLYFAAAMQMEQNAYPPLRKCYVYTRCATYLLAHAFENLQPGHPMDRDVDANVNRTFFHAAQVFPDAAKTAGVPIDDLIELANSMIWMGSKHVENGKRFDPQPIFDDVYKAIAAVYPTDSRLLVFKGKYLIDRAWAARGGGYANSVTPEGWRLFKEKLEQAEPVLAQAAKMNPNDLAAATAMLRVCLGLHKDRATMDAWFAKAMKASPDNLEACRVKNLYLGPQYYGSVEDMVAFGHECRDGQNWYGLLPFRLVEAHQLLSEMVKDADAYFHEPQCGRTWNRCTSPGWRRIRTTRLFAVATPITPAAAANGASLATNSSASATRPTPTSSTAPGISKSTAKPLWAADFDAAR
jgi:hypothetical protein